MEDGYGEGGYGVLVFGSGEGGEGFRVMCCIIDWLVGGCIDCMIFCGGCID